LVLVRKKRKNEGLKSPFSKKMDPITHQAQHEARAVATEEHLAIPLAAYWNQP
jgi:hypothetical protein